MEANTSSINYLKYKIQMLKKMISKPCSEQFKNDATVYCSSETHFLSKVTNSLKMKTCKNQVFFHKNCNQTNTWIAVLIRNKVKCILKSINEDKGCCVMNDNCQYNKKIQQL